jgi:hypothetical protein
MLLSLAFADEALAGLTGSEQLFQLRVPPRLNQQEVPIKNSLWIANIHDNHKTVITALPVRHLSSAA